MKIYSAEVSAKLTILQQQEQIPFDFAAGEFQLVFDSCYYWRLRV